MPKPDDSPGTAAKIALTFLAVVVVLCAGVYAAFKLTPWPSALLIRRSFDQSAREISAALASRVPTGIAEQLDVVYDPNDPDAKLDLFHAAGPDTGTRPVIVWVHGGGWVSGDKGQVANYLRILAGRGLDAVGIDYTIAPEATYPTPVRQLNAALGYLTKHKRELRIDADRIVLAGDSGGAHIASQMAQALADPRYAQALGIRPAARREQIVGMILFCGPYDTRHLNLEGPFGGFLRTVLWAYSGSKDFQAAPKFVSSAVIDYVTPGFPPAFLSAGNADPLESQSRAFADKLDKLGVPVDTLFFAPEHQPSLEHEYQFDLALDASREALERAVAFARAHAAR